MPTLRETQILKARNWNFTTLKKAFNICDRIFQLVNLTNIEGILYFVPTVACMIYRQMNCVAVLHRAPTERTQFGVFTSALKLGHTLDWPHLHIQNIFCNRLLQK